MPRLLINTACVLLAASLCTGALAQTGKKPAGTGSKKASSPPASQPDPNLLAGPSVEQEAAEQPAGRLSNPNNPRPQAGRGDSIPPRQWFNTVRELDLTQEQRDKVFAIFGEFQSAMREFQQAHADEMREVQEQIRASRESGKEPDAKLRETAQKLDTESPKPLEYQQRVWDLLTAEQRESMRQKVADIQKQMAEQQRRQREGGRRAAGGQPGDGPGRPGDDGMNDTMAGNGAKKPGGDQKAPAGGEMNDDPMMSGGAGGAAGVGGAGGDPNRPNLRERPRDRRRAAGGMNMEGLDDLARNRTEFLLAHQSTDRPGAPPTPEDKAFKFKEDGGE